MPPGLESRVTVSRCFEKTCGALGFQTREFKNPFRIAHILSFSSTPRSRVPGLRIASGEHHTEPSPFLDPPLEGRARAYSFFELGNWPVRLSA
jgi:hypothetical protein